MTETALLDRPSVSEKTPRKKVTAETLATKQRDISVSEFFAKNRHLLGFDNPRKALLTAVKEAVDNSLDACEEAGILPEIVVAIEDLEEGAKPVKPGKAGEAPGKKPKSASSQRYRVTISDNGPGIVRKQVENIFGRLLYGSKFHRLKMSRGQQGIGISAAGMYGLITTGKPMVIQTRPDAKKPAHHIELAMNTKTNRAEVTTDEETDDFPLQRLRELSAGTKKLAASGEFLNPKDFPTGTSVSIELEGRYQKGRGSVDEFLELTAIANPHARIVFIPPGKVVDDEPDLLPEAKRGSKKGEEEPAEPAPKPAEPLVTTETDGVIVFPRAVQDLPPETKEIQPHPKGVELGTLLQMLKDTKEPTLYKFLQEEFCRVSSATASTLCEKIGKTSRTRVADVEPEDAEKLYREFQEVRLAPPPIDCLAPIGVQQLLKGMFKGVRAEFYAASSREPDIYRGRPFLIEAAIAFGGELPADEPARVIRFANRVPLLYQQSACSSFKAVTETNWRNYDLQHPRNSLPIGPLVIMIHMASVWVPFTSESKEAIADYDEIRKEMKLALMECGRKLGTYLRKRARMRRESQRRDIFERYIGEVAQAIHAINGTDAKKLYEVLLAQAKKRTAIADMQLDDEGKRVKDDPADSEGVLIVEQAAGSSDSPPSQLSKAEAAAIQVASMAKSRADESQGKLIKEPEEKKAKRGAGASGKPSKEVSPSAQGRSVPETAPPGADSKPKQKLRMKLVKGKWIRVDEGQSLF
ncbi:MAG: DNA topoisomerase VI subunit B [Phycisphaeraceae bacterium]|nr:DNA topoisomerase VI subunit B [Phycisphaeraceae bacterium]